MRLLLDPLPSSGTRTLMPAKLSGGVHPDWNRLVRPRGSASSACVEKVHVNRYASAHYRGYTASPDWDAFWLN